METNEMLSMRMDTSDDWIRQRTGILQRHVATHETTRDLAAAAAERALEQLPSGRSIDQLILATTTPDRACPAMAPEVASRLGLGTIPAFDIAAVCSGFLYALAAARNAVCSGAADRVLIVAAETFTRLLDPNDRTTVPLFGDGAGAVIIEAGHAEDPGAIGEIVLRSDGALADLIRAEGAAVGSAPGSMDPYFHMQGQAVFLNAVVRMQEAAQIALTSAGWDVEEVDHFVGHQANARILAAVADRLDLPASRVRMNLRRVGNTAAASIPIALDEALRSNTITRGQRIALAAFGGGATWGAATLTAPDTTFTI
ncbi:beta-ketoacyl-ACP synthase 3 [Arthrobacter sp. Y-9]|uniref:beta-ketoacyl-ACP synthase 3 n=1 Tax=Arthrobacter sp. Y-9 TaxID=3039385 RepID=UPI0024204BD7|nr:beta-ketoacyl-ACP synthase 3 [Arthrobacter sp. Y-9]WFR83469.1 beta-ketoacyl-ACP synthase 3 [Arthrobacter sp. Y-9]